jgi:lysophospholipase L1-like esterase
MNARAQIQLVAVAALLQLLVAACTTARGQSSPAAGRPDTKGAQPGQLIAASDPRFRYEGRLDFADPAGPVVIWEGSRIRLDFEGARLAFRFDGLAGQSFFDAEVDAERFIVDVPAGVGQRIDYPLPLGLGRHRLVLSKRSEASVGHARFRGVEIAQGARAWASPPPSYRLRMEFFGDSITVGACNEDGAADQWEDRRTHNNALSYASLTAGAFSADARCTAVSGMGIALGWTDVKAGEVWDRLYPKSGAPRADLAAWQPDAALVNFGENDGSFASAHGQPFPAGFADGYVALVQAIRAAYPRTHLVLLRGGMYNGAQNPSLRQAWEAAVARLETADPAISHFVFTHWSLNHPRVADDRALADELTAWLRQQAFLQRFL